MEPREKGERERKGRSPEGAGGGSSLGAASMAAVAGEARRGAVHAAVVSVGGRQERSGKCAFFLPYLLARS